MPVYLWQQQFEIWLAAADKSAPTKGKVGLRRLEINSRRRPTLLSVAAILIAGFRHISNC
ncbi:MAG: hypothetical protein KF770_24125 [Anaerolineae bacterium]|nr:hypothetical protein [Anaerolineae bacterium]